MSKMTGETMWTISASDGNNTKMLRPRPCNGKNTYQKKNSSVATRMFVIKKQLGTKKSKSDDQ